MRILVAAVAGLLSTTMAQAVVFSVTFTGKVYDQAAVYDVRGLFGEVGRDLRSMDFVATYIVDTSVPYQGYSYSNTESYSRLSSGSSLEVYGPSAITGSLTIGAAPMS